MHIYSRTSALIVVDMQNDFADPNGSLYVAGGDEIISAINGEISRAVDGQSVIVYSQDWHPLQTPHFRDYGGVWPVHCVAESWGAELHPELTYAHGIQITKGTGQEDGYSAFSGVDIGSGRTVQTDLAARLREHGVQSLVVVGLAGDYCVKATALDGAAQGMHVTVPLNMTAFVESAVGDMERTVLELRDAGVTVE